MIYLDHNATTPVRPEARAAMLAALDVTGNASSVHGAGRAARRLVEDARDAVARLVDARPADIVFTSGATEANNQVLRGAGRSRQIISATEHDSVLAAAAADAEILPVDGDGVVDLDALAGMLASGGGDCIVAVMLVNNETGVIQPVADVVRIAHDAGALVHVDAVQALGRMPLSFRDLGADFMSISGHKVGAAVGTGALIIRPGLAPAALLRGGGQERRYRAGTENISGISALGAVSRELMEDDSWLDAARDARDRLESDLAQCGYDITVFGAGAPRVATTCCFGLAGVDAERMLMALDLDGVAVSSGSACSSGKVTPSHVLQAMGVGPDLARSAIRVSFGWNSAAEDGERFIEAWRRAVGRMRPAVATAA
ncbi:MAG: cysteine desulfurase family protein [Rhodospirillales bacterium]